MCFPAAIPLAAAAPISAGGVLAGGIAAGAVSAAIPSALIAGGALSPFAAALGPTGFTAAAGWGGAVAGGGGFLSALVSPQFSLATQLVGFGFQAYGQVQQNAYARARIAYEQGVLRNRQIVAQQNIEARQLQLQVQLGIIGAKGKQARGDLVVAAAGRGVLVGQDTELDKTQQLAGDVAFQKELARHRVKLQDREDELVAVGLGADSALLDFDRAESQRTLAFGIGSTAFKTAAGFSKFRFNRSGQLEFRT